ncbi:MAG: hypothetical protein KAR42_16050 [candidate division Zixibacteria bacterium]|nr:hypothetical protein [candidate division Zixibacteria bacterium]
MWEKLEVIVIGIIVLSFGLGIFHLIPGWGKNAGMVTMGVGIIVIISLFFRDPRKFFCADCGQYLGHRAKVCDRCGCNRFTLTDPKPGMTIKNK